MVPERTPRGPRAHKSVLFCADCGHESPVDGDWRSQHHETGRTRCVLECPDCGHVVVDRPRFEPATA